MTTNDPPVRRPPADDDEPQTIGERLTRVEVRLSHVQSDVWGMKRSIDNVEKHIVGTPHVPGIRVRVSLLEAFKRRAKLHLLILAGAVLALIFLR